MNIIMKEFPNKIKSILSIFFHRCIKRKEFPIEIKEVSKPNEIKLN